LLLLNTTDAGLLRSGGSTGSTSGLVLAAPMFAAPLPRGPGGGGGGGGGGPRPAGGGGATSARAGGGGSGPGSGGGSGGGGSGSGSADPATSEARFRDLQAFANTLLEQLSDKDDALAQQKATKEMLAARIRELEAELAKLRGPPS
jgi:hypothetical protein